MSKEILKWWDILIITFIMFSYPIYTSTISYISLLQDVNLAPNTEFSSSDNYSALIFQGFLLLVAILYLKFRNFNFSIWQIKISFKSLFLGILLFLFVGLLMDIYIILLRFIYANFYDFSVDETLYFSFSLSNHTISTLLYSILNGVYEEIYFLGICLAVLKSDIKKAFLFSLIVRVSFHTYQGLFMALGIGLIVGVLFFILYYKFSVKNLFIFFFAHTLADIFGASFLGLFYYLGF